MSAGFRPTPPAANDAIAWPADFGQRYTIFVDTEEEFDWSAPFDRDQRSVTAAAAIPAAARRFAALGTPLTYLVDHPIATDPAAIDPIRRAIADHDGAVGAQLHPWVNPPYDELADAATSFAGALPRALEAAKLVTLTRAIGEAFVQPPKIYRAGRYGLGPNTLDLLAGQGYRADSSMRARYDYARLGGPDYVGIGNHAFRTGTAGIVELPLTTVYTGHLRSAGPVLHRFAERLPGGVGALARLGLVNRIALTPEEMPLDEALEAVRIVLGEGLALLNFSFHSPSLVPGHTPYVKDAAQLADFWRWWDAVLTLLATHGVRAVGHDELLAALPCPCADTGTPVSG
ncbi:WalW protein [Sphingomonas sp.]|uniref:WalW protein n=1 Tax=Sphingomonas sp. TaxID=28214 RepID=UPI002DD69140|nr:WalW protein [Sphingomonas sp.]